MPPKLPLPTIEDIFPLSKFWRPGYQISEIRGGGVKILSFRGSRNLTLFYRDSVENPQFGGQKSKLSKDNFRGEFPPPPLPYPGLRKIAPVVRVLARQLSGKNCLAAIFASRHQDASLGPLGTQRPRLARGRPKRTKLDRTLSIKFANFLEISYFRLEISCVLK